MEQSFRGRAVEDLAAAAGVERGRVGGRSRVETFGNVDDLGGMVDELAVTAGVEDPPDLVGSSAVTNRRLTPQFQIVATR